MILVLLPSIYPVHTDLLDTWTNMQKLAKFFDNTEVFSAEMLQTKNCPGKFGSCSKKKVNKIRLATW